MLELRRAAHPAETARKSLMIQRSLFALDRYAASKAVMTYVSLPDEVQTGLILSNSLREGKKLAVPSLKNSGQIIPSLVYDPEDELSPGCFGVLEPAPGHIRPYPPAEIDLVIVPGVAFDCEGNRLGMGGGYYDKFLSPLSGRRAAVGLAFGFQVISSVPSERHDTRVDFIITEDSVIDCSLREITLE